MEEAKVKLAVQEGVDHAMSAAQEGGAFFHKAINAASGDLDTLNKAFDAAGDAYKQAGAEAADYGRMFVSAGKDKVAAIAHIPDKIAVQGATAREWVNAALQGWPGAEILEDSGDTAKAVAPAKPDVSADDQAKDAIGAGVAYMREKGGPVKP